MTETNETRREKREKRERERERETREGEGDGGRGRDEENEDKVKDDGEASHLAVEAERPLRLPPAPLGGSAAEEKQAFVVYRQRRC